MGSLDHLRPQQTHSVSKILEHRKIGQYEVASADYRSDSSPNLLGSACLQYLKLANKGAYGTRPFLFEYGL